MAILLTYGTARILLAGDAEAREEEYMANGPYTGPLTVPSTFRNYTYSEPRFRALLTEGGAQRLELSRSYSKAKSRLSGQGHGPLADA